MPEFNTNFDTKHTTKKKNATKIKNLFSEYSGFVREQRLQKIKLKIDNLCSNPILLDKLMVLAQENNSSIEDYENLLKFDIALVIKLFGLVNSSYFSFSKKARTIKDALQNLKINSLNSMIFAAQGKPISAENLSTYGYKPHGLLIHSIAVATIAKAIAVKIDFNESEAEEVYSAGLLHDAGKLVLLNFVDDFTSGMSSEILSNDFKLLDIESKMFMFNHIEVNKLIADTNQFSNEQIAAMCFHHDPMQAGSYKVFASVIHCADCVSNNLGYGMLDPFVGKCQLIGTGADALGFSKSGIRQIAQGCEAEIQESLKMLNIS